MVRVLLPVTAGTLVTAATGSSFHLTPTTLTLASLITGAVTAIVVAIIQTRKHPSAEISLADDALSEYAVKRLAYLETECKAKDDIIAKLHEEVSQLRSADRSTP